MVNPSKAQPGQKAIDTRTWNGLVDMWQWWNRTIANGKGEPRKNNPRDGNTIRISNDTGGDLARYSVLEVGAYSLTTLDRRRLFYAGDDPTNGASVVAVLQQSALDGEIVEAQLTGVCPVLVSVGATWHRRAYPTAGANVLTSGLFGPFEILGTLAATGSQTCVCRMNASNRTAFAITTSAITAGSLATAQIDLGSGTANLYPPASTLTQYAVTAPTRSVTVYNLPGDAVANGVHVALIPTEDWLPLAVIEPCTALA